MKEEVLKYAQRFPDAPGVYLFKDKEKVLYVGKAGSLRKRIKSYFSSRSKKVIKLLEESKKLEYIPTETVLEALILEANLIKRYWPIYNVRQKDDRSFVYIAIPDFKVKEFPFPILIRGKQIEKYPPSNFHLFGPYQSYSVAKKVLFLLRKIFPYCSSPNANRPCFYYQIGLCKGACIGKISATDYQRIIHNLLLFLRGEREKVVRNLEKESPEKLKVLQEIEDSSLITREELQEEITSAGLKIEGYDISHFAGRGRYGSMVVFQDNQPIKEEYRIFKIKESKAQDDVGALKEVIERRLKHKEWRYPDLFLIDGGKAQVEAVYNLLTQAGVSTPVLGIVKGKENRDEIIFKGVNREIKELLSASKPILQYVRDEAHRFALKFCRRSLQNLKK